jgi:hypothetical protein
MTWEGLAPPYSTIAVTPSRRQATRGGILSKPEIGLTWRDQLSLRRSDARDTAWRWMAWKLPGPLVYWAAVRLMSRATGHSWNEAAVPDLTALDALMRWQAVDRMR